jgi:ATP-dependent DNA helicase
VVIYHGDKDHRAELRRNEMWPADDLAEDVWADGRPPADLARQRGVAPPTPKPRGRAGRKPAKKAAAKSGRKPAKRRKTDSDSEDEEKPAPKNTYPVILTTYEMIIRDQKFLCAYSWGFIVVGTLRPTSACNLCADAETDEGHRLKNFDSRLMQEIKKYESAGRMVLTGTPLQNNLAELWSLLNFVLPDLFTNLDSFQQW